MITQRALSHHGVPVSGWNMRTNREEGRWQDKSRKVLGGWMSRKSRNNNARGKCAHDTLTLLNAVIRWQLYEPDKVRVGAP